MNPDDLIQAIRSAFAPTPNQQRTQHIIDSNPVADSLWATMNNTRPNAGTSVDERFPVVGPAIRNLTRYSRDSSPSTYNPLTQTVALTDGDQNRIAKGLNNGRRTLIHEAGHHADRLRPGLSALDKRFDFREMTPDEFKQLSVPERRARNRVDGYYRTNPGEGYAQAYTSAFEFLSGPRSQRVEGARWDRETVMRKLADMEGRTPGAGEIVRDLLKKDIFRGHPLSEFVR